MPTAARLISSLCLAGLAFVVSGLIPPLMPEGTDMGYFTFVNMAVGIVVGWAVMGPRAGHGVVPGINNGLTGMAVMVLVALFIQGAVEMFRLANRLVYDDPFEALASIFTIALEYFFVMAVPNVLFTLVVGGVLAGLAVENAWRRWR